MEVFVLKQGDFSVNKQKEFFAPEELPAGLKMAVQPFLIAMRNELVLLDAGLDLMGDGRPMLFSLLEAQGFSASDVSKILISHFHKDHVDGLLRKEGTQFVANFPDASIYFQQRELDHSFMQKENPSYDFSRLEAIAKLPNLIDLKQDSGQISEGISYEVTSGHSRYHQEFWLRENGETIFFGSDNLPQKSYLDFNIAYKSDENGKQAALARQQWKARAEAEHWQLLLYHDQQTPVIRF